MNMTQKIEVDPTNEDDPKMLMTSNEDGPKTFSFKIFHRGLKRD